MDDIGTPYVDPWLDAQTDLTPVQKAFRSLLARDRQCCPKCGRYIKAYKTGQLFVHYANGKRCWSRDVVIKEDTSAPPTKERKIVL